MPFSIRTATGSPMRMCPTRDEAICRAALSQLFIGTPAIFVDHGNFVWELPDAVFEIVQYMFHNDHLKERSQGVGPFSSKRLSLFASLS